MRLRGLLHVLDHRSRRSKLHNFHLVGKGVNRKSGLAEMGTLTWKVKLSVGPLGFFSDKSPKTVNSVTVT